MLPWLLINWSLVLSTQVLCVLGVLVWITFSPTFFMTVRASNLYKSQHYSLLMGVTMDLWSSYLGEFSIESLGNMLLLFLTCFAFMVLILSFTWFFARGYHSKRDSSAIPFLLQQEDIHWFKPETMLSWALLKLMFTRFCASARYFFELIVRDYS